MIVELLTIEPKLLQSLKYSQQKSVDVRNKVLIFRLQVLSIRCALCLPLYALFFFISLFSPQLFFICEVRSESSSKM